MITIKTSLVVVILFISFLNEMLAQNNSHFGDNSYQKKAKPKQWWQLFKDKTLSIRILATILTAIVLLILFCCICCYCCRRQKSEGISLTPSELIGCSPTPSDLQAVNITPSRLKEAGASYAQMAQLGATPSQLVEAGANRDTLQKLGATQSQLSHVGFHTKVLIILLSIFIFLLRV